MPLSRRSFALVLSLTISSVTITAAAGPREGDWAAYGRTALGGRHSPLVQITKANVDGLQVAWRYHTGETEAGREGRKPARLSATPLVVDGRLFFSTPFGKIIALDAGMGRELWKYDAQVDRSVGYGDFVSRGVSYWADPQAEPRVACASRIIAGVIDGR